MPIAHGEFRGQIYDNILDTIGATPIVRLSRLADEVARLTILGNHAFEELND